jgi:hypothetical protein
MKASFFFLFIFSFFYNSLVNCQESTKVEILKNLFSKYELEEVKGKNIFSTKARNKFASIPLTGDESKIIELNGGASAFLFTLYLSDNEKDFESWKNCSYDYYMDRSGEDDPIYQLHKNQRLIQLLIIDSEKSKLLGKPDNFPIKDLFWFSSGYGDTYFHESISNFKTIDEHKTTFYLELSGCGECESSYYFVHFENAKITTSKEIKGCLENIKAFNNKVVATEIANCYDAEFNGEVPITKMITVLEW